MPTGGHSGTYPPMPRATCGDAESLSTHEAAEITGIGQAAFKSGLHQARLRVPAAIGDQAPGHRRRMSRLAGQRPRARGGTQAGGHSAGRAYADAETRERPRGSGVPEIATKALLTRLPGRWP
jgi:hypothetical protein